MNEMENQIDEKELEQMRIAILRVGFRESVQTLSQILAALPEYTRIVRIDNYSPGMSYIYFLHSQKFKPVPHGEEPEEIQIEFEYSSSPHTGEIKRLIKSLNYPTEITFPALKKQEVG